MSDLSSDELLRIGRRTAQDVIAELSVADSALDLMMYDESVSLEMRGKLSLLIEQIRQAAARAKKLIMLSHGGDDVRPVQFDKLIADLIPLLRRLLPKNIDVQFNVVSDLWSIKAHQAHFEQALISLFVRARNAMLNGGSLTLRAVNADEAICRSTAKLRLLGDHVLIEINDTGIGIPPDHLRTLFDPFAITKGPANGFELAKVYWAVRNMNGNITVKSEIGSGSTFTIFMPRSLPKE